MLLLNDVTLDSSETFSSTQAAQDPPYPQPFLYPEISSVLIVVNMAYLTEHLLVLLHRWQEGQRRIGFRPTSQHGAGIQIQILIMLFPPHHPISPPPSFWCPDAGGLMLLCPLTGSQLCGFCLLFRRFFPVPPGLWYFCSSVPCFLTSPVACTGIWEAGELFYMMNPGWFTTGPYSCFWMSSHWSCQVGMCFREEMDRVWH